MPMLANRFAMNRGTRGCQRYKQRLDAPPPTDLTLAERSSLAICAFTARSAASSAAALAAAASAAATAAAAIPRSAAAAASALASPTATGAISSAPLCAEIVYAAIIDNHRC